VIWLVNTPIICVCFFSGSFGRFDPPSGTPEAEYFSVLFLKKYSLKRKVIRTGKKRTEVVPATSDDLEKGTTEEVQAVQ
jgi:hypothetical protein